MPLPTTSLPLPLQRAMAVAVAAAGLVMLAGCPRKEAPVATSDTPAAAAADTTPAAAARPTASATLKRAELMALAFPDSRGPGASPDQSDTVLLPTIGDNGKAVAGSEAEQKAEVSPREVVRLDDTHAVMLTDAVPLSEDGHPMNGHPDGAWLGAYFFEQGPEGWKLSGRNDAVDYQGFMGNLGQTKVERLGTGQFVTLLTNGSCWQGTCGEWLSVFSLAPGKVRPMVTGIALGADNQGGDEACEKVLKAERPAQPPRGNCFDISGKPAFPVAAEGDGKDKDEMHIAFSGSQTNGADDPRARKVDTTLVYVNRNGAYELREGRNPVPSF